MIIETVSKEEFLKFKDELLVEIRQLLSQRQTQLRWMKAKDVKKILPLSPATLQTLRLNGTLPFTKVGGAFYYNIVDIERMMSEGKIDNQIPEVKKRGRKTTPSLK